MELKNFHTRNLYSGAASLRPARLVWNTTPTDNNQKNTENQHIPDHEKIADKWEFFRKLEAARDLGIIDSAEHDRRKGEAEQYYEKKKKEQQQQQHATSKGEDAEKTLSDVPFLDKLKKFERSGSIDEAAKKAAEHIEGEFFSDLNQLRNWVLGQMEEVGITKEMASEELKKDKEKKEIRKMQAGFMKRVRGLLNPDVRNHQKILKLFEREDLQARRCAEKARSFVSDGKRRDFMKYLASKDFSATGGQASQIPHDVQRLLFLTQQPIPPDDPSLIGNILAQSDLPLFEQAIDAIELFYKNWHETQPNDEKKIEADLNLYKTQLKRLHGEFTNEDNLKKYPTIRDLGASWPERHQSRQADITTIETLLKKDILSESDRKLATVCLKAYEKETKDELLNLERLKVEIEKAQRTEAKKAAEEKAKHAHDAHDNHEGGHDAHGHDHDAHGHGDHGHHGHHGHGEALKEFYKNAERFFTAKGRITWYSFHDIGLAWHVVTDAFKKNAESVGEDKAGKLAHGLTAWRPVIAQRAHRIDLSNEKKRAGELKESIKNLPHDDLLKDLALPPPKDTRRAILETIADRGNLLMSDKKLVSIVLQGAGVNPISEKDWRDYQDRNDYSVVYEIFKDAIDGDGHGTGFIGEIGYGKQLLETHGQKYESQVATGKRGNSKTMSGSATAEFGLFTQQVKKAGLEGEGKVKGMIDSLVQRSNTYSHNGSSTQMKILVDGKEETINCEANLGNAGLVLTDAFLRGYISRETLGSELSKGHEGSFIPYAAFQSNLTTRGSTIKLPDGTKKKISNFEAWGWIDEEKGTVTKLGATEIPKYFNTRNALSRDKDGVETIRHVAIDADGYLRHSRKHTDVSSALAKDTGDKVLSALVKASTSDLFRQATSRMRHTGAMSGQMDQIAGLIKACTENIIDGSRMMKQNERYYNTFDQSELSKEEAEKMLNDPTLRSQVGMRGRDRRDAGKENLLAMFDNLIKYTDNRDILGKNGQYKISAEDADGNMKVEDGKVKNSGILSLGKYITDQLQPIKGTKEYDEIIAAFDRLNDPSQKRSRAEIEKNAAQNTF